jgi:uncharacterized membrane protein YagU involved in acid resistance
VQSAAADTQMTSATTTFTKAWLLGGFVAGVLDAGNGVIFNYFANNLNPIQVLQYIASGFFGSRSFDMGLLSAAIGAGAHFFIAFVLAIIYVTATRIVPIMNRYAILLGLLYGVAVFLTMNFIVLKFTNTVETPITTAFLVNGLFGHALLVGLPIALCARKPA